MTPLVCADPCEASQHMRAISPDIDWFGWPRRALRWLFAAVFLVAYLGPSAAVAQTQKTPPNDRGARWEGTSFRVGDSLRLDPRIRIQADFLIDDGSDETEEDEAVEEDRFSWGSRRIGLDGELFQRVSFQVERAFQDDDDDDTKWRDVYADYRFSRALRVRGGRFKLPFSLERTTSRDNLDFLERATAVRAISPSRDTGVMVHGEVVSRVLGYEVGVFQHADGFDLEDDTNVWEPLGSTLAGRVRVIPVRNADEGITRDLEFGVALTRNTVPEGLNSRIGRMFDDERFTERMHVNGQRTRLGLEGRWNARRVIVKGEWLQLTDQRTAQSVANEDLSDLVLSGGYLTGVFRVVGETGADERGVDVAMRFDRLSLGSKNDTDEAFTNPRADNVAPLAKDTWTFGVSWYVHRWVKVQGNLIRENLVDSLGVRDLAPDARWTTVMRLQFAL
jgi:phosphate-selective porin